MLLARGPVVPLPPRPSRPSAPQRPLDGRSGEGRRGTRAAPSAVRAAPPGGQAAFGWSDRALVALLCSLVPRGAVAIVPRHAPGGAGLAPPVGVETSIVPLSSRYVRASLGCRAPAAGTSRRPRDKPVGQVLPAGEPRRPQCSDQPGRHPSWASNSAVPLKVLTSTQSSQVRERQGVGRPERGQRPVEVHVWVTVPTLSCTRARADGRPARPK